MARNNLMIRRGTYDLSWEEFYSIIDDLEKKICSKKKSYDVIVGINRGGLIPSVMLSHRLDVKHGVTTIESYQGHKKAKICDIDCHVSMIGKLNKKTKVLLVDDIADSGESLVETIKVLEKLGCDIENIDTATLHYKLKSSISPTFIGSWAYNDLWINYPWEQE